MAGLGSLYIDLAARTGKFETDIGRAARLAEKSSKQIQQQFSALGRNIGAALGSYFSVQALQSIIRISDEYTQLRGRLALVTKNTEELGQVQQSLFAIAQRTRTEYSGVADLYIKVAQTGKELGASQQELLKFTEGVGNALTVSGSNAEKASGALLQLSQALAGGTVRAEEFNSIVEGAPQILRTVASNMEGMDGSIAKLRKAMLAGQLSSKDFFQAFLRGSDELSELAQSMPVTVGQAFIRLQNNINQAIAGADMSPIVNSINDLSALVSDSTFQQGFANLVGGILAAGGAALKVVGPLGKFVKTAGDIGALIDNKLFGRELPKDLEVEVEGPSDADIDGLKKALELADKVRSSKDLNRLRFFGKDGIVKWWDDQELDTEISRLKERISSAQKPAATTPAVETADPPAPSKEFLRLSAALQKQIAIHGNIGKAAEISAEIQEGLLDKLSKSEQQQLLALARRYDAVVKNADAQKKAAEEQKKAVDEVTKMTQSLEQQIATFGKGETATVEYRIAHGDLAKAFANAGENGEALKKKLIDLTSKLEIMTAAANGAAEAVSDFASQNSQSLNQGLESFEADFETRFLKGIDTLTVFQEQAARNTQDIIADTLISGFDQGADGVLKSFGEMLKKIIAQAVAADIAKRLFGAAGGGTGSGWIGAAAGALGFGGKRAIGGPVLAGMTYRINEREPEFFRPRMGGDIIPLSKMPNMGGGTVLNQNFSVRTESGERVSRRTEQQIAAAASRGLAMASRRNN